MTKVYGLTLLINSIVLLLVSVVRMFAIVISSQSTSLPVKQSIVKQVLVRGLLLFHYLACPLVFFW